MRASEIRNNNVPILMSEIESVFHHDKKVVIVLIFKHCSVRCTRAVLWDSLCRILVKPSSRIRGSIRVVLKTKNQWLLRNNLFIT